MVLIRSPDFVFQLGGAVGEIPFALEYHIRGGCFKFVKCLVTSVSLTSTLRLQKGNTILRLTHRSQGCGCDICFLATIAFRLRVDFRWCRHFVSYYYGNYLYRRPLIVSSRDAFTRIYVQVLLLREHSRFI